MTKSTQPQRGIFRRFITPPVYPDEDKTRAARLLHAILMIMWVHCRHQRHSLRLSGQ